MTYLMRNNCNCPICAGAVRQFDLMFYCQDCKARYVIKDEGLTDGEYVCEKLIPDKEAVCV